MLSPATQFSLNNALSYFSEHLKQGDYYSQNETVNGEWFGQGAEKLGLSGAVTAEQFEALCKGMKPGTDEPLTVRRNTVRVGKDGESEANRRVFYDWVFAPSKSYSLHAYLHEPGLIADHNEAVKVALKELEKFAATRVRLGGYRNDRRTGNLVVAQFQHDTSREQDPHCHTHAVCFNATWDPEEQRWKALQNGDMLKAQLMVRNLYHHELAKRVQARGIPIKRTKNGFEIEGYTAAELKTFSKRRSQIQEILVTERAKPENAHVSDGELKDRIAHEYRARKIKDAKLEDLRAKWKTEFGSTAMARTARIKKAEAIKTTWNLETAYAWASEYVFERKAVAPLHMLEAAVMSRLMGSNVTAEQVHDTCALKRAGFVLDETGSKVTSLTALAREERIIRAAQEGRGTQKAIVPESAKVLEKYKLDPEQQVAASKILESQDTISIFQGRAGTGKSFTLKAIHGAATESGAQVLVCAPQTGQRDGLIDDKLPAQTIAAMLAGPALPKQAVVICDEAGQVGGKTMDELVLKVKEANGRLILSGDTRQHGSVEASDSLLAIERHGKVTTALIQRIRRQDPEKARNEQERARITAYRDAVSMASEGRVSESLQALEELGAVKVVSEGARVETAADRFMASRDEGNATLVVTQTRKERDEINLAIASKLEAKGVVTHKREMDVFTPVDTATAERALEETFTPGRYVRWFKNYGNHKRGSLEKVLDADESGILLEGHARRVSYTAREKFDLVEPAKLPIGVGSRLQTRVNGNQLVNGELVTVKAIAENGTLTVANSKGVEKLIPPEVQVLNLGYCVTSYASQGKTTDKTIVSDAGSEGASSDKEWFVSISRGRRDIEIITADVEDLRERIKKDGSRELAYEMKRPRPTPSDHREKQKRTLKQAVGRAITHAQTAGKLLHKQMELFSEKIGFRPQSQKNS